MRVLHHAANRGKGCAIRTGLAEARGRFVVVQDAALEYDPQDLPGLLEPLPAGTTQVVYGSRYLKGKTDVNGPGDANGGRNRKGGRDARGPRGALRRAVRKTLTFFIFFQKLACLCVCVCVCVKCG